MNSLASPPHSDPASSLSSGSSSYFDPAMRSLLASTWQLLQQSPPPSLREILGAYKSKGDGDRDMLLAMLHAKSAEDNRLASTATLHQTMLELQLGRQCSPHPHPRIPSITAPSPTLPIIRVDDGNASSPRKRARSSESSRSRSRSPPRSSSSSPCHSSPREQQYSLHNLPPSPYSDNISPRMAHTPQRGMAIGSLLSESSAVSPHHARYELGVPRTSDSKAIGLTPSRSWHTSASLLHEHERNHASNTGRVHNFERRRNVSHSQSHKQRGTRDHVMP